MVHADLEQNGTNSCGELASFERLELQAPSCLQSYLGHRHSS